jgi:hypothetical protein
MPGVDRSFYRRRLNKVRIIFLTIKTVKESLMTRNPA